MHNLDGYCIQDVHYEFMIGSQNMRDTFFLSFFTVQCMSKTNMCSSEILIQESLKARISKEKGAKEIG